ncbi:hypothetical protein GCM10027265_27290 [Jatrophihabitans fulvus]
MRVELDDRPDDHPDDHPGDRLDDRLGAVDAYWRAANYLSAGQLYLAANPLLREPLLPDHVKPRLLGHWGTAPGINLVHAHLNRVIRDRDLDVLLVTGPGHGGAALLANSWLDGSYTERFPSITRDAAGMARLFRQYSFPGGVPSHAAPSTPGSIHEGGELGYSLAHAFGAVLDSPDALAVCIVGDGEAETGPLAASWSSTRFLDARTDGAVLPVLHLNGWKIANPSVLARIPERDLLDLLRGHGCAPVVVAGDYPADVHPGDEARRVLAFAFEHAAAAGVPLHAITCHQPGSRDAVLWHEVLAEGRERHPHVPVRRTVLRTGAADGLLAAAAHHDLVVVGGARAAHPRRHPVSLAHTLVRRAGCSVAVVPTRRTTRADPGLGHCDTAADTT